MKFSEDELAAIFVYLIHIFCFDETLKAGKWLLHCKQEDVEDFLNCFIFCPLGVSKPLQFVKMCLLEVELNNFVEDRKVTGRHPEKI